MTAFYFIAAVILILAAVISGQGRAMLQCVFRGFGWGIGREIARGIFRRRVR
jgi:hypothetical protein